MLLLAAAMGGCVLRGTAFVVMLRAALLWLYVWWG
jgi:hypothetical protein